MKSKAITRDTATASFRPPELSRRVTVAASIALACAAPAFAQSTASTTGGTTTTGASSLSGNAGSGISVPALAGSAARSIQAPVFHLGVRSTVLYSDNLGLRPRGQEESELVLSVAPYVEARSDAPRAKYSVIYQMGNSLRFSDSETDWDTRQGLNANGSFALQGDNLWLDASAWSGQVSTSIDGAMSIDQGSSFANIGDYTSVSISPWYQNRLGSWATYNMRYSYSTSWGDQALTLADSTQFASAAVDGVDIGRAWNWSWYGTFQRTEFGSGFARDRRNSGARVYYRVNNRLRVYGGVDYEQIDFVFNDEGDDFGWGPSAGFDWNPNSRLSISANASERYYGNVGGASVSWTTARSSLGVSYSRSLQTNFNPSALSLDPLALTLNPQGTPSSVTGSLRDTGIVPPGGIPINGALVTDSAILQERLGAFWGLRGPSRSLTLSAWVLDSETANQVFGGMTNSIFGDTTTSIRGGTTTTFAGELRERGAQLQFNQSLGAGARGEITLDYRITESPTLDFENRLTTLRAMLYNDLDPMTTVFGGLRVSKQRATGSGTAYDENAVFGGLDYRFR